MGSSIMAFCKIDTLEMLSLYMCKQFSDTDMCYTNMCSIMGFRNLKVLDVRYTSFGDDVLRVFGKKLYELYFTCYATTYHGDDARRRCEVLHGAPRKEESAMDKPLIIDDVDPGSFKRVFAEEVELRKVNDQFVNPLTDSGTKHFR